MAGNKSQSYVRLLLELSKDSSMKREEKARKFIQLLRRRGDTRLFSKILRDFGRKWQTFEGKTARIVSAKKLEESARDTAEKSLKKLGYQMQEEIDTDLKEGSAIFLGNDYLIDGSVNGKLKKILDTLKK